MRGSRVDYDRAYGAFLVSGLAALIVRRLSVLPMDTGTAGGIGLLIAS